MSASLYLALAILLFYSLAALDVILGNRRIRRLADVDPQLPQAHPTVSLIVAARNEARNLRPAIRTLLELDYPGLEVIVVNDRSEDETGPILAELSAADTRLQVVTVEELPYGWLGKNHALWLGSQRAQGELLLFTDADIIMEPSLLRRAVVYLEAEQLDHLAVSPRITMPGAMLQGFALAFMLFFAMYTRPWKARDPKSHHHIGIGAFNLVRSSAYRDCGGHEAIRLRPDDDLKLGKLLKKNGFAQELAAAPEYMAVEWYASVGEVVHGLEKNAFSGCDYRLWMVIGGAVLHSLCSIWPFPALLLTSGLTRTVYALVVGIILMLLINCAQANGVRSRYALYFPLASVLFVWIILRNTALNLWQGGIHWRGTFYSLHELKQNRI